MSGITASMVKELRERTGAGMMEAKNALVSTNGNIDDAIKALRESGAIKAEKKADRDTNEGCIAAHIEGSTAALVEIQCETDFVAKNDDFRTFAAGVAKAIALAGKADDVASLKFNADKAVSEMLTEKVLTIGENLKIGKAKVLRGEGCFYGLYIHSNGKIGVLTQIKGTANEAGEVMAKDIAMHAAFTNPISLDRSGVPAEVVAAEREIYTALVRSEGKPENIIGKIVDGKVNAFYKDRCLSEQIFVKDNKRTITQVVSDAGAFELTGFAYLNVGA